MAGDSTLLQNASLHHTELQRSPKAYIAGLRETSGHCLPSGCPCSLAIESRIYNSHHCRLVKRTTKKAVQSVSYRPPMKPFTTPPLPNSPSKFESPIRLPAKLSTSFRRCQRGKEHHSASGPVETFIRTFTKDEDTEQKNKNADCEIDYRYNAEHSHLRK